MSTTKRPAANEAAPYYHRYINQVSSNHLLTALENGKANTVEFWETISTDKWDFRYADDKWTIKEVVLHVIDTERVMAYRALRIGRGDNTPMPGFDQNLFAPNSNAANRSPKSLIEEYQSVRDATLALFRSFDENALSKMGNASGSDVSALALGYIIAGHEIHHNKVLKERYL